MPACLPTPMTRPPAWNSLNLPANQAQATKTGQAPGKPATTHQIPSCGVIQVKHNATDKKYICSTVDIKKTLQGLFNQLGSNLIYNHPKLVDCFNGGTGTTKNIQICGGFPTAGGSFAANGANGGVNYTLPVYNPIRSPGPISCGGSFNATLPSIQGGVANSSGITRPSRPSSKQNWTVEWLIRRNAKTTSLTELSNWEIGLKNTIQPELNGDKGSNGQYNFCAPKTPGGGGGTFPGGFCGTPNRKGGGFCGTPNMPRRGMGSPGGAGTMGSGVGGGSRGGPSKSSMFEREHPIKAQGPYADRSGGRSANPVKIRNICKSIQANSVYDRPLFCPTLPDINLPNFIPQTFKTGASNGSNVRVGPVPGGNNIAFNGSTFQNRGMNVMIAKGGQVYGKA